MTVLVRSGVVAASRRYALELVRPSSVDFSGTSADIVGLGSVDFSAVTSLSLNGVFSAEYDNYMINMRHVSSGDGVNLRFRLRFSGTDESAANDYVFQSLVANSTTVSGARGTTDTFGLIGGSDDNQRSGSTLYIYGPNLAQPTAARVVNVSGFSNAAIVDYAWTHDLSTAYDGFTVFPPSGTITGNVAVYGLRG